MNNLELLGAVLRQPPIAFRADYAHISGCSKAGLMLSQLVYWSDKGTKFKDGWFEKDQKELYAETGLTFKEQQTCRHRLAEMGVIEFGRYGDRGKLCYRVVLRALVDLLEAYHSDRPNVESDPNYGMREVVHVPKVESENAKGIVKNRRKANLSLHRLQTETTDKEKPAHAGRSVSKGNLLDRDISTQGSEVVKPNPEPSAAAIRAQYQTDTKQKLETAAGHRSKIQAAVEAGQQASAERRQQDATYAAFCEIKEVAARDPKIWRRWEKVMAKPFDSKVRGQIDGLLAYGFEIGAYTEWFMGKWMTDHWLSDKAFSWGIFCSFADGYDRQQTRAKSMSEPAASGQSNTQSLVDALRARGVRVVAGTSG